MILSFCYRFSRVVKLLIAIRRLQIGSRASATALNQGRNALAPGLCPYISYATPGLNAVPQCWSGWMPDTLQSDSFSICRHLQGKPWAINLITLPDDLFASMASLAFITIGSHGHFSGLPSFHGQPSVTISGITPQCLVAASFHIEWTARIAADTGSVLR
jgi:hypothetical protein